MALTKSKKKEVIDTLKSAVASATSLVFVNFHGINVENVNAFRRQLHENGVKYLVSKKTLAQRALSESSLEGDIPVLEGELGIAYSTGDMTVPAREVFGFQKKLKGVVSIIGGVFEGKLMDKEQMTEIAQIPDMHTLQAQFVNVINSPIQGLAVVLNAIAESKEQKV